nr:hypothetical protein [Nocardioides sp. SYSU D00065]
MAPTCTVVDQRQRSGRVGSRLLGSQHGRLVRLADLRRDDVEDALAQMPKGVGVVLAGETEERAPRVIPDVVVDLRRQCVDGPRDGARLIEPDRAGPQCVGHARVTQERLSQGEVRPGCAPRRTRGRR